MASKTRTARKTLRPARKSEAFFSDRVRFNWGYHDAANAVRNGWACEAHNFGFARGGKLDGLTGAADVLARHFDSSYAKGWTRGLADAQAGKATPSSEPAFQDAVAAGQMAHDADERDTVKGTTKPAGY